MARKRKEKEEAKSVPLPPSKEKTNYKEVRFPDGSMRAVRTRNRSKGNQVQTLCDFFGVEPDLPTKSNQKNIETLIIEVLHRYQAVEDSIKPEVLAEAWQEAVGAYIASQSELVSLINGRANIETSHPAVKFELTRLKAQVIRILNKRFGEKSVKQVRIRLK